MAVKIGIFLIVFGIVFYIAKLAYPFIDIAIERWHKKRMDKITPKLDRMFLDINIDKLMILDIAAPFLLGLLGLIISKNIWVALIASGIGLLIPIVIVKRLEAVRRQKFASQLVDGLMILSSSLKAGLSLMQSFEELVEEMPAPISQEFNLVIRQMQMGVSLEEALVQLKKRLRLEELDMVVTAILVARETGGDLTVTFSRVIYTIQERNKLNGRVKSLCIQAKLQGGIMSALPVLFALFVYQMQPNFFDVFFKNDFGKFLLAYAFISEILGVFFIRKFSRVDV